MTGQEITPPAFVIDPDGYFEMWDGCGEEVSYPRWMAGGLKKSRFIAYDACGIASHLVFERIRNSRVPSWISWLVGRGKWADFHVRIHKREAYALGDLKRRLCVLVDEDIVGLFDQYVSAEDLTERILSAEGFDDIYGIFSEDVFPDEAMRRSAVFRHFTEA